MCIKLRLMIIIAIDRNSTDSNIIRTAIRNSLHSSRCFNDPSTVFLNFVNKLLNYHFILETILTSDNSKRSLTEITPNVLWKQKKRCCRWRLPISIFNASARCLCTSQWLSNTCNDTSEGSSQIDVHHD